MTQVYVVTSAKYHWALRPFSYLFNVFWSELQSATVITDILPPFTLPHNFKVESVSGNSALPKERWSDGLIVFLQKMRDSHFVLLLEDYWLIRKVDNSGVETLADFARKHPEILRVDLTDDRQYNGKAKNIGSWGHYDLVETPNDSAYQMSLQAGVWSRDLLLSVLKPGMSPWEVELYLSPSLHDREDLRVIGTKQCPVRYVNVLQGGRSNEPLNLDGIPEEHRFEIERRGWILR